MFYMIKIAFVFGDGFRMSLLGVLMVTVFGRLPRDFALFFSWSKLILCYFYCYQFVFIPVYKYAIGVIERVFKSIHRRIFC